MSTISVSFRIAGYANELLGSRGRPYVGVLLTKLTSAARLRTRGWPEVFGHSEHRTATAVSTSLRSLKAA